MHSFTATFWEKGSKTAKNQDSLALCQMVVRRKRCLMAVVCDGIGSIPDAEQASGFVTEQLVNWFYHEGTKVFARRHTFRAVQNAVKREIYRIRRQFDRVSGKQGCTLSMLLLVDGRYFIWHVGDSRIYRGRKRNAKALTTDDVYRGMLTKCIGTFPWKGVVAHKGHLWKKDTFLVCSDGFYKKLSDKELETVLLGAQICGERQAQKMLVEAATRIRAKGESDDISAIYIKIAKGKEEIG